MNKILRYIFFGLIVRFVVLIVLGINVRRKELLPRKGPAIIVANHNSHLDTMVLMTLLPFRKLHKIHPVAAADYFLSKKILSWFALKIIGIIPISREVKKGEHPLKCCFDALEQENIIIFYPEGSRGEPEEMSEIKKGIVHLAKKFHEVPIIPVFMHGLGKALPKGDPVLVPFFCDVFVEEPIYWNDDRDKFFSELTEKLNALANEKQK